MKLLIALDESAVSLRAAKEAARLFPHGEYLVVNVARRPTPWIAAGDFGTVYPATLADLPPEGMSDADLAELANRAGLDDAELLRLEGDPAHAICEAAEGHDVDVVVVGSHDKGVLRRLVDPSVADAVVQGTYRPVLVVSGEPPAE
jgi:nucleotide-binding universal stress UspA family protein